MSPLARRIERHAYMPMILHDAERDLPVFPNARVWVNGKAVHA
jgi:hypothetical protein